MPIDVNLPLQVQTPDIAGSFQHGMSNALQMQHQQQQMEMQRRQMALQEENGAALREDRQAEAMKRRQQASDAAGIDSVYQAGTTRDQVIAAAKAQGHGHLVPMITKQWDEADAASAKAKEAKQKSDEAEIEYGASLAYGVKQWLDRSPEEGKNAAQIAIKHAEEQGHDMSEFKAYLAQNPDSLPQIVNGMIMRSPKHAALLQNAQKEADAAKKPVPINGRLVNPQDGSVVGEYPPLPAPITDAQKNTEAETARHNKAMEASGAVTAAAAAKRAEAAAKGDTFDVSSDIQTTVSGGKYVDGSGYTAKEKDQARKAASAAGAVMVSKDGAEALANIDNARLNQKAIMDQIGGLLPKDAAGRVLSAPGTALARIFQTNEQKAAFSSWRSAAINTLRATAGSKGLRINQAEIAMSIENDIPKLTDTIEVAQQKVKNINTMLDNAEKPILVRDRSAAPTVPPPDAGQSAAPVNPFRQQSSNAPPAAAPSAAMPQGSSQYQVGQTVRLKDGRTVKIKAITPQGIIPE